MRSIKVLASVVLGLALCAGTAQASAPASFCDPVGSGSVLTDSLTSAEGADARGTVREPTIDQVHQDLPKKAKGKAPADFGATPRSPTRSGC